MKNEPILVELNLSGITAHVALTAARNNNIKKVPESVDLSKSSLKAVPK